MRTYADVAIKVRSRAPRALRFSQATFEAFESRLESHWGGMLPLLPNFADDLLAGRWKASGARRAPSDVIGDFGEFISQRVFRQKFARRGTVLRVLRAARQPRPDFLVFNEVTRRLTALESKAGAVNAALIRDGIRARRGQPREFNICGLSCRRKAEGLKQIARDDVVIPAGGAKPKRGKGWIHFGKAKVIAHQSAVATPVFLDGRMGPGGIVPAGGLRAPRRCGVDCVTCLCRNRPHPALLVPIYINDRKLIAPLEPSEEGVDAFVAAYSSAGAALWVRSSDEYVRAVRHLAEVVMGWTAFRQSTDRYMRPLLDAVAAGLEDAVIPAAKAEAMLAEPLRDVVPDARATLARIAAEHVDEEEESERDGATVIEGEARPVSQPRRGARRPKPRSFEEWVERWHERTGRIDAPLLEKFGRVRPDNVQGTMWRERLERDPTRERVLSIETRSGVATIYRPSYSPGAVVRVRVSSHNPEFTREAIAELAEAVRGVAGPAQWDSAVQAYERRVTPVDEFRRGVHSAMRFEERAGPVEAAVFDESGTGSLWYRTSADR